MFLTFSGCVILSKQKMFVHHLFGVWMAVVILFEAAFSDDEAPVVMKAEPRYFYPEVTQSVSLTCSMTSPSGTERPSQVVMMQIKRSASNAAASGTKPADKNKTKTKEETSKKGPDVLLAGVSFHEGTRLHVTEDNAKQRMEVEGDLEDRRLVLTIRLPGWGDAGTYLCLVSAMRSDYTFVYLSASSNLSVLGEESSALLLAREQVMESHQRHTEEETIALQQEVHNLKQSQLELTARLKTLEDDNKRLASKLDQVLSSEAPGSPPTPRNPDHHAPTGDGAAGMNTELQLEVMQLKSKLDQLESKVLTQLRSRVDALNTTVSGEIKDTLKSLSERLSTVENYDVSSMKKEQEEGGKGNSLGLAAGGGQNSEKETEEEKLQEVSERLDTLERKAVEEISQQVSQQQQKDMEKLGGRLDNIEKNTVKDLEGRLSEALAQSDSNKERIVKMENNVQNLQTVLSEQTQLTECFVCGDMEQSIQCTADDIEHHRLCPVSASFCMNDIIQDAKGRHVYKRCVSEEDCVKFSKKSDTRCQSFTFMTTGDLECHFCCSSDRCNQKFRPDEQYHHQG
ncbi:uncharacterized protein LOC143277169 [Babylonia areolata]|uniref:uncharacterized protein LOC143277169 n=1 Tax=Babylonia areolata TaxID=304850 RepID=UPI003FD55C31